MAESRYSEELTKRGFTLISPVTRNPLIREIKPYFTPGNLSTPITFAKDEIGQTWMATKLLNLSDMGFEGDGGVVSDLLDHIAQKKNIHG